jgi:hypothetical protein
MRGVVYQDVDAAQLGQRLLDDAAAMIRLLYVACNENGFSARLLHKSLGFFCVVVLAQIRDKHIGTLARIRERYRAADATVRAPRLMEWPAISQYLNPEG